MKQNNEEIMLEIPKHRPFTYEEKKINRMNKDKLLDYLFVPKLDREQLRFWVNEKYGKFIGDRKLKQIMIGYEIELRKKITPRHHEMIDEIFALKETFQPLEIVEVMAIQKQTHILNVEYAEHSKVTQRIYEKHLIQSINAHVENWTKSMQILKEKMKIA